MGEAMKMFEGFSGRMLVGWFLILWGLTFFFSGIWGFLDIADGYYSSAGYLIIEVLWDLADLAIAGILALLGLRVLKGDSFKAQVPPE